MRTKERKKLPTNNKKHIGRKQNTFLQSRTFTHYRNERIKLHYRNCTLIKREINSLYVKNYKLNRTELRDLKKRNNGHYLDSQEMKKIS